MTTIETFKYDNRIVRNFAVATVIWGLVGMLGGLLLAIQLCLPQANFDISWLTFGRVRPLHTNAVIFAFVGNGIFMGVYYSLQRLCKARMFNDLLSRIHFWGWQFIIVCAAISLPAGKTSSKEYAELEWPIDVLITVIWVIFAINLFGTIIRRRERHMYVAIWFYIATVITVAVLHIVNSLAVPVELFKSYSVYAGVQDALVQWWYGHNAVAFFLTTPYLGLMYYFLPKAADRPVFSYRLSIIHFWSLIFLYIWAGPHHLLFTSLPDWAQSLGMVFSLMLIAPSWGGMLNGLLTLRGAWDKVRKDPVLKFFVVAVTSYGMATLEGPLMAIKSVNALSHYTDWTIAHVHTAALGWNGFFTFGLLYWIIPTLYKTPLYSKKLANYHFAIGLTGILVYVVPMYWAGVTQGLMWKQFNAEGFLAYPNFLETVTQIIPMYWMRATGGLLYIVGAILMSINLIKTMKKGELEEETVAEAPALEPITTDIEKYYYPHRALGLKSILITGTSLFFIYIGAYVLPSNEMQIPGGILFLIGIVLLVFNIVKIIDAREDNGEEPDELPSFNLEDDQHPYRHRALERKPIIFTCLSLIAILIGGMVEMIPTFMVKSNIPTITSVKPYTALELQGRDLYIREGCVGCHSQMIRPFRNETERYGTYSKAGEFVYDHPFLWGSKRIGPDLHRIGKKYPDAWHYRHMIDPSSTSPGSIMPKYPWLIENTLDNDSLERKITTMRKLGVPYPEGYEEVVLKELNIQAKAIAANLSKANMTVASDKEIIALIAYLQRLGTDIKGEK